MDNIVGETAGVGEMWDATEDIAVSVDSSPLEVTNSTAGNINDKASIA